MSSGGFLGTHDRSDLHKVVSMPKVPCNWYIIFDKFVHFVFLWNLLFVVFALNLNGTLPCARCQVTNVAIQDWKDSGWCCAEVRPTGVSGGKLQQDCSFTILILGKQEHRPSTVTTEVLEQRAFSRVSKDVTKLPSFRFGVGNEPALPQDKTPQFLCPLNRGGKGGKFW